MLPHIYPNAWKGFIWFQWAPTLGGECYERIRELEQEIRELFQWAPTLGGECYADELNYRKVFICGFQWAPTLGGECYNTRSIETVIALCELFQWAPTLGGECYNNTRYRRDMAFSGGRFNGHPPLGVNATRSERLLILWRNSSSFNGHPPLGVNATV